MKPLNNNKPSQKNPLLEKDLAVLLVDDNKVNQFLGKRILSQLGISGVDVAGDGNAALEILKTKHFDVLLTDVEMPGMSGYELCTAVRQLQNPKNRMIVIALTGNGSAEDKEKALAFGMNDYLIKPYTPQELLDVLLSHVQTRNSVLATDFAKPLKKITNPVEHIYALFNNNREDTLGLLQMLSKQIPELVTTIKKGVLDDDWDSIFQASHKLKSSIKLFNDEQLSSLIFEINELAREQKSIEQIPDVVERFVIGAEGVLVMINRELESY